MAAMYLVIDIGNTLKKAALFNEEKRMLRLCHWDTVEELRQELVPYEVQCCLVSTVRDDGPQLVFELNRFFPTMLFSASMPLPIVLCYDTPDTLGTDRIACAVGAHALYPEKPVLTLQAGTCLVADMVTANGEYLGGSIAPGMRMRFASLAQGTARLPLVQPKADVEVVGTTTDASILSGVIHGLHFEIEGLIQHYRKRFPGLKVVMTGGDAPLLKNIIKNRIFAAPNLVLFGLYKILKFNASSC